MACRISFLSRQSDVIASFSFGALLCTWFFIQRRIISVYVRISYHLQFYLLSSSSRTIMSSPGQRRGSCGHAMANFDSHAFCARCREKGKGSDDCVKNPQSTDCKICNAFSEEQRLQLATPSYRIKKEKREAKKLEATPAKDSEELVDPSNVSVIGPVEKQDISPTEPPPDKKTKKDTKKIAKREKSPSASTSKTSQGSTDDKIATLDSKWSERFNRLEALLLARNVEPNFSADVKVTPARSPPASVSHSSEPFIRPSSSATLPQSAVFKNDQVSWYGLLCY